MFGFAFLNTSIALLVALWRSLVPHQVICRVTLSSAEPPEQAARAGRVKATRAAAIFLRVGYLLVADAGGLFRAGVLARCRSSRSSASARRD